MLTILSNKVIFADRKIQSAKTSKTEQICPEFPVEWCFSEWRVRWLVQCWWTRRPPATTRRSSHPPSTTSQGSMSCTGRLVKIISLFVNGIVKSVESNIKGSKMETHPAGKSYEALNFFFSTLWHLSLIRHWQNWKSPDRVSCNTLPSWTSSGGWGEQRKNISSSTWFSFQL